MCNNARLSGDVPLYNQGCRPKNEVLGRLSSAIKKNIRTQIVSLKEHEIELLLMMGHFRLSGFKVGNRAGLFWPVRS